MTVLVNEGHTGGWAKRPDTIKYFQLLHIVLAILRVVLVSHIPLLHLVNITFLFIMLPSAVALYDEFMDKFLSAMAVESMNCKYTLIFQFISFTTCTTHTHTYTYTYIHIRTCTYTYIHLPTHTYTYLRIHTHTYIHLHTHTYIHIHTFTDTYIHIQTHTYIHIRTHTYTYIHSLTYTYIYVHTHTYIHT